MPEGSTKEETSYQLGESHLPACLQHGCLLLSPGFQLQGNADEKGQAWSQTALGEILALTISGKSLNLSEPVLWVIDGNDYYLSELLEGLEMTSGKCLINSCFSYGGAFG